MLRRTALRRWGYQSHDVSQDQMLAYSPFGWNYLLPQNMTGPWKVNRTMTKPFFDHNKKHVSYAPGVWVGIDGMDPAMYEALRPWLSKLALGRTVPATDPAEAVDDFKNISPRIDDGKTLRCWLAKVLQLCAMKKNGDVGMELWKNEAENSKVMFPSSSSSSSSPVETDLAVGLLYCASASSSTDSDAFRALFTKACREWNASSRFPVKLWDCMLRGCGAKKDETGVLMIINELVDLHFDLDVLHTRSLIAALNCVKSPELYAEVKKLLHNFSPEKTKRMSHTYVQMRRDAEKQAEAAEEEAEEEGGAGKHRDVVGLNNNTQKDLAISPDNDSMFYHVMWHDRVRQPLSFFPRRLYFDFKPSLANFKSDAEAKRNANDLVGERIARWKEEGLLPEDYDQTKDTRFYDKQAAVKAALRTEHWKKKPKFLDKPEYGAGQLQGNIAAAQK